MLDNAESDERPLLPACEKLLSRFVFANDGSRFLPSTWATKACLRAWRRAGEWWGYVGRYLVFVIACSLIWESIHMPLYTLWAKATVWGLAADVVVCTGANMVIASVSLAVAMIVVGNNSRPLQHPLRVALLACGMAVAYTLVSEWLNVQVFHSWAYSSLMPLLPGTNIGASPILQWIVTPSVALWWARRCALRHQPAERTISDN